MTAAATEPTSCIYQHVWPILDPDRTRSQLVAEAHDLIEELAEQAGVLIVGPPFCTIEPAAGVPGWTAWPGDVLIARAPAQPIEPITEWRERSDIDTTAVDAALAGSLPATALNTAEKRHVVALLVQAGLSNREIGMRLRWHTDPLKARNAVQSVRRQAGIACRARPSRAKAAA